MKNKSKYSAYVLCSTALMGALAAVLQLFEFPMPFIVPDFVKFDFSDLPVIMSAFLINPISGVAVCLIKNVIHIVTSSSAGVGELANFLIGAPLALGAGYIYRLKKTKGGAILACVVGSVLMGLISIPVNYYITYPFYINAMHFPLEAILGKYNEINPDFSMDLWSCLIFFNMPFTIIKGAIVSAITLVIYKPISKALHSLTDKWR